MVYLRFVQDAGTASLVTGELYSDFDGALLAVTSFGLGLDCNSERSDRCLVCVHCSVRRVGGVDDCLTYGTCDTDLDSQGGTLDEVVSSAPKSSADSDDCLLTVLVATSHIFLVAMLQATAVAFECWSRRPRLSSKVIGDSSRDQFKIAKTRM